MGQFFRRNGDVFAAPMEDTILLMNVTTDRYHGLNPVAAYIWDLLAEPTEEAELVTRLVAEFEVSPEECQREVAEFLAKLRARGLLLDA
jgi:hypothetical protein